MRRYLLHIGIVLLSAFAGTTQAQIVDTVCALGGNSHLGVSNPTPGSTYQWTVNGGTIVSGQGTGTVEISWLPSMGLYDSYVVETSASGCVGDTVNAKVYITLPSTTYITGPTIACEGQWIELKAVDTKRNGKFFWSTGDSTETISFYARQDTSVYRVVLNQNCENDTVFHHLKVLPTPLVNVIVDSPSDTVSFNSTINYEYTGSSYQYLEWYLNNSFVGTADLQPIQFTEPGWNRVMAIASAGQCADTLFHNVFVEDDLNIQIPTAFSPNGDGINDVWNFGGLGFDEFEVTIVNRWGTPMAHWDQNTGIEGWDGTYQGRTVDAGAYAYRIKVMTYENHLKEYSGSILVIR